MGLHPDTWGGSHDVTSSGKLIGADEKTQAQFDKQMAANKAWAAANKQRGAKGGK